MPSFWAGLSGGVGVFQTFSAQIPSTACPPGVTKRVFLLCFFTGSSSCLEPAPRGAVTCPHGRLEPFLWAILITIRLHTGNGCWKRLPRTPSRKSVFERREVKHWGLSVANLKVSVFPRRKIKPPGAVLSSTGSLGTAPSSTSGRGPTPATAAALLR